MNLQQAKSLFFAQYMGQQLEYQPNIGMIHQTFYSELNTVYLSSDTIFTANGDDSTIYCLLLKSVSDLTDEEKINVARLVCARHNRHYQESEITYKISKQREFDIILIVNGVGRYIVQIDSDGVGFVDHYMGGAGRIHYYAPAQYAVTDYLRSLGVLLPFTYINENNAPIILSPEQIIALGWAKYLTP